MSGAFKKMFGSRKADPSTPEEAATRLNETLDLLRKKSDLLERQIADSLATARKYANQRKDLALKALARKRLYEKQLKELDNSMLAVESQLHYLQKAGITQEVLSALKSSSMALKKAHKGMRIEDVSKVMDDIAEQQEVAEEISEVISNTRAYGIDYDEDELLAELEGLQAEELEEQLLDVGSISDLPSVPTTEPAKASSSTAKKADPDKDLNELLAWAE